MSVATTLLYFFFGSQDAQASAIFGATNADGVATVVTVESAAPVVTGGAATGGRAIVARRWWLPFARRVPRTVTYRARGGALIAGSARVLCVADTLTEEELLLLLELELI